MNGSMSPPGTLVLRRGLARLRASAMIKQSLLVFAASMVLNICGFIAHAVASRQLGVTTYGELYALINAAVIAALPAAFVAPVVAQLAAEFRALHDDGHLRGLPTVVSGGFAKLALVYLALALLGSFRFARFLHVPVWSVPFVGAHRGRRTLRQRAALRRARYAGLRRLLAFQRGRRRRQGARQSACSSPSVLNSAARSSASCSDRSVRWPIFGFASPARYASSRSQSVRYDWRRILNAGAGAAAATVAIALMGSADVVLVKHFFDAHAAGLYAAASLGGKTLLYLVGFVPTVLLPQAADRHARGAQTREVLFMSLVDVLGDRTLRALHLQVLRDVRAARARRARLRRGGAAARHLRPRDGPAGADQRPDVLRNRDASPRFYGAAIYLYFRNAGRDRDVSSVARDGRRHHGLRQRRGRPRRRRSR